VKRNPRAEAPASGVDYGNERKRTRRRHSTPRHEKLPTPEACPRFARCNANVCPLDSLWPRRSYIRGESICLYLREVVKTDGKALLRGCIPTELLKEVVRALPRIIARYSGIHHGLIRAATTPSKIAGSTERRDKENPPARGRATGEDRSRKKRLRKPTTPRLPGQVTKPGAPTRAFRMA